MYEKLVLKTVQPIFLKYLFSKLFLMKGYFYLIHPRIQRIKEEIDIVGCNTCVDVILNTPLDK